jgi:hypothetical protein
VELAEQADVTLFHTPQQEAFAAYLRNGHREVYPVDSGGFRNWLLALYRRAEGVVPNKQAVEAATYQLTALATNDGATAEVSTRVAWREETVYLDLCDDAWQAVAIDAEGWRVVDNPPVYFRRSASMRPLPTPAHGGSLDELRPFLNVEDDGWVLCVAWLLGTLMPAGTYPVLSLQGEQGSAKSTAARVLHRLVDESDGELRQHPSDMAALALAAKHGLVLSYDNLSRLSNQLSDALCCVATGATAAARKLYTNDEEHLIRVRRPLLLTGIGDIVTRGDLVDRTLTVRLRPVADERRRTEEDFWAAFEARRPHLLGALLDAASAALHNRCRTRLGSLPRLADFAVWVTAAEAQLGWPAGSFMAAYQRNRDEGRHLLVDGDCVAQAVVRHMARQPVWEGTPTELYEVLTRTAPSVSLPNGWPRSVRGLSDALERLAPNLRTAAGIDAEQRRSNGRRLWRLVRAGGGTASAGVPQVPQVPQAVPQGLLLAALPVSLQEALNGGTVPQVPQKREPSPMEGGPQGAAPPYLFSPSIFLSPNSTALTALPRDLPSTDAKNAVSQSAVDSAAGENTTALTALPSGRVGSVEPPTGAPTPPTPPTPPSAPSAPTPPTFHVGGIGVVAPSPPAVVPKPEEEELPWEEYPGKQVA